MKNIRNGQVSSVIAFVCVTIFLSGCAQGPIASFRQPNRLYDISSEEEGIKDRLHQLQSGLIKSESDRNEIISLRMYAIDLQYTKYESQLTHEDQGINLAATAVNLGLTGASTVIPSLQATHIVSAVATGLTGATTAYDKEILLSKTMQNVQTQMRTNRMTQAAKIIANMDCSLAKYPMGMALSDLEAYYRAGTLTAGLISLSTTLAQAEDDAKNKKDSVAPAPAVNVAAIDKLDSDAAQKNMQAAGAAIQKTAAKTNACKG